MPRATTAARGYGAAHQRKRAEVKREVVDPGNGYCWRCDGWIDPTLRDEYGREIWDLGHDDNDRTVYRGPECRDCNRATHGRRPPSPVASRNW